MKESSKWNLLSNAAMILFTALALIPFILLIIASFTDNQWATVNGFSFWPAKWSMEAYNYIASSWKSIGHAYLMTIVVTILGTFLSLCVTTGFAYALSDPTLPGHRLLNFLCVFTMLFS
ncbi:MAG: carbohydrate ABC transporter permease, partial [Lachnospiraceae bacterium]